MAKNPDWSSVETTVLLEKYQTKEMHELQEILTKCYFPRPAEGIKRRLERLYRDGLPLDIKRIEYLRKRRFWRKEDHRKFNEQLHNWRVNNPIYFSRWLNEHPDYLKRWFSEHKGYSKISWKKFRQKHPDYRYKRVTRHIDNFFPRVFNSTPELPLKEISVGIENLTGISLKENTLEKLLLNYEGKPRGPPIVKTETGNYRLNDSFYRSQN